jgi:CubicO group peptidase (beta-lactamase class C family)
VGHYGVDPVMGHYGVAARKIALDPPIAFDENSLYRIYSMTKSITGVATMMLMKRGELGLDQPLIDVIPDPRRIIGTAGFDSALSIERQLLP